jgi:hypothetical protein
VFFEIFYRFLRFLTLCDHRFYGCDHKIKFGESLNRVAPMRGGFMLARSAQSIGVNDDFFAEK